MPVILEAWQATAPDTRLAERGSLFFPGTPFFRPSERLRVLPGIRAQHCRGLAAGCQHFFGSGPRRSSTRVARAGGGWGEAGALATELGLAAAVARPHARRLGVERVASPSDGGQRRRGRRRRGFQVAGAAVVGSEPSSELRISFEVRLGLALVARGL